MFVDVHTHSNIDNKYSIINICVGKNDIEPENIFSAGIHPWHILINNTDLLFKKLDKYLIKKNIVAIGEIGLDRVCDISFEKQKFFFEKQLQIAEKNNLPVILHSVKTYSDLLFFRKKYKKVEWIVHDYNGNKQISESFIDKKIYFSFGKNFMRNRNLKQIIKQLPLNSIFFETDDTDYKINTIYEQAAKCLNIEIEQLQKIILNNFKRIFIR